MLSLSPSQFSVPLLSDRSGWNWFGSAARRSAARRSAAPRPDRQTFLPLVEHPSSCGFSLSLSLFLLFFFALHRAECGGSHRAGGGCLSSQAANSFTASLRKKNTTVKMPIKLPNSNLSHTDCCQSVLLFRCTTHGLVSGKQYFSTCVCVCVKQFMIFNSPCPSRLGKE